MTAALDHPVGSRSRAGNAMGRARAGVLEGALQSVSAHGVHASTMGGIAVLGGVAKATVYNHFRSKDEVFAALVVDQVERTATEAGTAPDLGAALKAAADRIAEHPARETLAAGEPHVLAALAAAAPSDALTRSLTVAALESRLDAARPEQVDLVLRVLASFLLAPGTSGERGAVTGELAAGLAVRTTTGSGARAG